MPGVLFYYSLLYFFETGSLPEPGARLIGLNEPPVSTPRGLGLQVCMTMSGFLCGCWDPKSGTHVLCSIILICVDSFILWNICSMMQKCVAFSYAVFF